MRIKLKVKRAKDRLVKEKFSTCVDVFKYNNGVKIFYTSGLLLAYEISDADTGEVYYIMGKF